MGKKIFGRRYLNQSDGGWRRPEEGMPAEAGCCMLKGLPSEGGSVNSRFAQKEVNE